MEKINLTDFNNNVVFDAGKTLQEVNELIRCINHNCDNIYFDLIPIKIEYNHNMSCYEICTTYEYTRALEYCLKDMYHN